MGTGYITEIHYGTVQAKQLSHEVLATTLSVARARHFAGTVEMPVLWVLVISDICVPSSGM